MSDDSIAEEMLRTGYDRWLRLEEEKDAIGEDLKELFAELKGKGFTPKALRESFRRVRNINDASQQEHDAVVDLYVAALTGARPARTREDEVAHDADGVVIEGEEIIVKAPASKAAGVVSAADEINEIPVAVSPAQSNGVNPEKPVAAAAVGETADNSGDEPNEAPVVDGDSVTGRRTPQASLSEFHSAEEPSEERDGADQPASAVPHSDPAALAPETAEPGDRGASSLAATVVAEPTSVDADAGADRSESEDRAPLSVALAPVANDYSRPNPICQDPEDCGIHGSWNFPCGSCLRRKAATQAAGAVQ